MTRRSARQRRAGAAVFLAAAVLLAGCQTPGPDGPDDSFGIDFSMPPTVEVRGAIVFFVDGVNASLFRQMLEANELPATRKYFVDRGLYCPAAVASMPSVTLPNEVSVVTGRFPGHHGVLGIRWFDREQALCRDYATIAQKNKLDEDYTAPTLFEQFPGEPTYSSFFQAHRGATVFDENTVYAGASYFLGWFEYIDRMTLGMFRQVAELARAKGRFPAITFCYMLAPDFHAYRFGVDKPEYRHALLHTDRQIGRVLGDMERAGILDKLLIALVSDHGMTPTPHHLDLAGLLRDKMGLDLATEQLGESTSLPDRQTAYAKRSAVLNICGNRFAAVHLRGNGGYIIKGRAGWEQRSTPQDLRAYADRNDKPVDVLGRLVAEEAVDAVACRAGENRVRVRCKRGEVEFRQPGGQGADITYSVTAGRDPLQLDASIPEPLAMGRPASPRRWLEATHDTLYPDLPAQVLAYFRSKRAGDLAVFAAPGWDFVAENQSGHGGIRAEDVCVPMLLAGPGVPHATVPAARTVDLAPTILKLLGKPVPQGADGTPLVPE